MTVTWTCEALVALGPTTDVQTTADVMGVCSDTVYAMIRRGEWTATRVLYLGRKIRIPTRDLITLLYSPAPEAPAVPSPCQQSTSEQANSAEPQSQCGCSIGESAVIYPLRRSSG